jgi:hypothetical protein
MRLRIIYLLRATVWLLFLISAKHSSAQVFSEDHDTFVGQAAQFLRNSQQEAYLKIGQDFQDVWSQKLQSPHRDTVIYISREMEKKRYPYNNFHRYFFSYVAEAVAENGVQADQLSRILNINVQALQTLSKQEYFNFLYEMNAFFGNGLIHRTRNTSVVSNGGTFDFESLGAYVPPVEEYVPEVEEISEEELLQQQLQQSQSTSDPFAQQTPASDPFASDPFSNASSQSSQASDPFNTDPFSNAGFGNQSSSEEPASDPFATDPFSNAGFGNQQPAADPFASDPFSNAGSGFDSNSQGTVPFAPVTPAVEENPAPQNVARQGSVAYKEDFVAIMQGQYPVPQKSGPVLNLKSTQLVLVTPYDSLLLNNVEGTQLLKDKVFIGEGAKLQWPQENIRTKDANVDLEEFFVKVDRGNFWTPNAKMTFPPFITEPLPGVFKYRSITRRPGDYSNYPMFTSYYADAAFDVPGGDAIYEGGFEVKGNRIFGNSVSKDLNLLTINDGKGRKAVITSRHFVLGDSLITSENASFSFFHGADSIYHPRVKLYYYPHDREMSVMIRKGNEATPFNDSYHRVQINAEVFKWHIEQDSIDFDIVTAKSLIPVTVASEDYFNDHRYQKMSGSFDFHPISIVVYFANKYGVTDFNYADLVQEYKLHERMVFGAMVQLEQYNFIIFNEKSGHVTVLDKAYLYYDAAARKRDFDNLYIPSKLEGLPNASMNLDSLELLIRGVNDFYMTTDFKVRVKPLDQEVKLLRNRQLLFDGEIEAGDFDYKGHDFMFDYDAFLIDMANIDSIALEVTLPDSLASEPGETKKLENHLTETSGTLYLNEPSDRSNNNKSDHFPYFESESEAIVYFDGEEVLDGAYDKSVKFIIPPLEVDDIDREDATSIQFPGTFNSGGIFPDFEDTLHIMPDQSLGFVHEIPEDGYNLYGTPARTYENITLSSDGMRGQGKIDFLNATIFSEDFIYYPDSVTANGYFGTIEPGQVGAASFPQAEMGSFRMYWLPKKDSMFLRTIDDPFSFYNATAKLTGAANVTQQGVYGYGSLLTRGSIAESENLSFQELTYSATHADFRVLSDDPDKPAMAGDDINLYFDLTTNTADVHPERVGVAAISFPYAQIKTSITNATWFLEDSIITMTKPEDVSLEDTYFYSTRAELDSLSFNGEKAIYDIKSYELNVQGIPYILAADAKIIPEGNETTILADSKLQTFTNAEIIFEYPEAYHYLTQGVIDIQSRKNFSGTALYMLPVEEDTFEIKMSSFYLEERFLSNGDIDSISVSNGLVSKSSHIDIAPGFLYQGGVTLRADKQALELAGFVKPDFKTLPNHDFWVSYERTGNEIDIFIDMAAAVFENGDPAIAGLHYGTSGKIYHTFLEERFSPADDDFFRAKGTLSYDRDSHNFRIEEPGKSTGERYQGHTFYYSDSSQAVIFEGQANFLAPERNLINVGASVLGLGNRASNEFEADVFFTMDFKLDKATLEPMAVDLIDIIERLGNPPANDLSLEAMLKIANVIGEDATKKYEKGSFKDYIPLFEASPSLEQNLVISGVKMVWNDERNAWHNTTKLAISNVNDQDVNAKMDGFIEFGRDDTGGEVMNLFIQAAPGSWYYFNYQENSLLVFSSNKTFNEQIGAKSNFGSAKPGELVLILGDENETLKFLNEFRRVYFGVEEPYNLVYPDEMTVEDENFDTIEEDEEDDDGFGF